MRGIMAKARRSLGFVTHVTCGMPPSTFRHHYTGLVLPHIEFCSPVWSPFPKSLEQALESVQHRAAYTLYRRSVPRSALSPYRDISTTALLQGANWHSLAHRRDVASTRLLCKLMGTSMKPSDSPRFSARTGKIQPLLARTLRHLESCLLRAARNWCSLPPELTVDIPVDPEDIRALCRQASSVFP
uniref:Putative endonuclease/reverse transcript n=1 Tax=Ixodes ricinus TaxID=34613 RepID=A0A6B0UZM5_IXORI